MLVAVFTLLLPALLLTAPSHLNICMLAPLPVSCQVASGRVVRSLRGGKFDELLLQNALHLSIGAQGLSHQARCQRLPQLRCQRTRTRSGHYAAPPRALELLARPLYFAAHLRDVPSIVVIFHRPPQIEGRRIEIRHIHVVRLYISPHIEGPHQSELAAAQQAEVAAKGEGFTAPSTVLSNPDHIDPAAAGRSRSRSHTRFGTRRVTFLQEGGQVLQEVTVLRERQ